MIEWVPYSDHKIKVCSQNLVDARWLPLALILKSVGNQELLTTVNAFQRRLDNLFQSLLHQASEALTREHLLYV
jgi:hypothetical protein